MGDQEKGLNCCVLENHREVGLKVEGESEGRTMCTQQDIKIDLLNHRVSLTVPDLGSPYGVSLNFIQKAVGCTHSNYHTNKSMLPDTT